MFNVRTSPEIYFCFIGSSSARYYNAHLIESKKKNNQIDKMETTPIKCVEKLLEVLVFYFLM